LTVLLLSRFAPCQGLLCAKHLLVAAIDGWVHRGLRRRQPLALSLGRPPLSLAPRCPPSPMNRAGKGRKAVQRFSAAGLVLPRVGRFQRRPRSEAGKHGPMRRPSAFAVLRLITNSNLVGCCTGRSAGWAPLRILVDVAGGAPKEVSETCPIGHEPAGYRKFPNSM
jgi:hypothetical protein